MTVPNHEDYDPGCISLVPIFSDLSLQEMGEVAAITQERHVSKGETVYFAGRTEKQLFVIHQGRVKISRISESGKVQVIRVLGPGDFMGELSVLHDMPRTDFAEALQDCTMCVIPGEALKTLMQRFPSIALKALEELSTRVEQLQTRLEQNQHSSPEYRIARAILDLSGGSSTVTLPMTKGDLASQLGMTQETLSRKLSSLQEAGLINQPSPGVIRIIDRSGLEAVN